MEVKFIGKSNMGELYEVGEYTVRIFTKPGRKLMSCTCLNHTKFCNENPICKHKEAVIIWKYQYKKLEVKI